jgi:hypothetical protein
MTKIHILSDLHNEISSTAVNGKDFPYDMPKDTDVLVLAGDIDTGTRGIDYAKSISAFHNIPVVYVCGNHEYYNVLSTGHVNNYNPNTVETTDLSILLGSEQSNVWPLFNSSVIIGDVRFIGATLWTDFGNKDVEIVRTASEYMNDYVACFVEDVEGHKFLTPHYVLEKHEESVEFITQELNKPFNGKTVVVTHHAPSFKSIADEFKYFKPTSNPSKASHQKIVQRLNSCYYSDLDHLVKKSALWVHGHTHKSFDYSLNEDGTGRVVCNPRGYSLDGHLKGDNPQFDPMFTVDI